ncbi:hypothetical protein CISIN_1g021321mg [Citrus sinensis]|uniref:Protease Do-like 5, chloroplastic n=1 Tax=Citrus sinensis TaxID=2711 RepID=A0A067G9Z5_CITSI|nr:hypothetical protein CISIN_1g021321mg [Citrus sinensis]
MKALLSSLQTLPVSTASTDVNKTKSLDITRRSSIGFGSSVILSSFLVNFCSPSSTLPSFRSAIALQQKDELQLEEDRVVQLFQETSPSVVSIQDLELSKNPKSTSSELMLVDGEYAKVEGTGSGFVWDKFGHIVTNYHVVAKLATDTSGLHRCKVSLFDAKGNGFYREGKMVGCDPAYDLAVLKVDVEGFELKPVVLGTSHDLRVGQSCFAIGNPYGFEDTLTTGVTFQ